MCFGVRCSPVHVLLHLATCAFRARPCACGRRLLFDSKRNGLCPHVSRFVTELLNVGAIRFSSLTSSCCRASLEWSRVRLASNRWALFVSLGCITARLWSKWYSVGLLIDCSVACSLRLRSLGVWLCGLVLSIVLCAFQLINGMIVLLRLGCPLLASTAWPCSSRPVSL